MESLAYLHLASSYEVPSNTWSFSTRNRFKFLDCLDGTKLSSRFLIRLLAMIASLISISLANHVLALPLQREDTGPEVEILQRCLVAQNYLDTSTFGYFGPKTETAVLRFQQENSLPADGIVGSATVAALGCRQISSAPAATASYYNPGISRPNPDFYPITAAESSPSLSLGASGVAVEDLQRQLRSLGYYNGAVDGVFGSGTQQAVVRFQRDRNLSADGVVGAATWATLRNSNNLTASNLATNNLAAGSGRPTNQFGVLELQRRLKARGFYPGPLDGDMGPSTQRAIVAAQRFYGVSDRDVQNGRF